MGRAKILSIATNIPTNVIDQESAFKLACQYSHANPRQTRVLKELYKKTSINKRHNLGLTETAQMYEVSDDLDYKGPSTASRMETYKKNIAPMAIAASKDALAESGLAPEKITHIITVSCTGFYAPGFDFEIMNALKLSGNVSRFHLGFMGCNGAVNGLNLLRTIIEADSSHRVLLCAAELCSLHYQYGWQSDDLVANSLFADCAAAVVAESCDAESQDQEQFLRADQSAEVKETQELCLGIDSVSRRDRIKSPLSSIIASKSFHISGSSDAMTWTIGDSGFNMTLSAQVPDVVKEHLPGFLSEFLSSHGLALSDINSFAIHPGGPRILRAVKDCLSLDENALRASEEVLLEYGNMSSPTVLFILERLRNLKRKGPCLVLAFGPGLVIEAILIA